MAVCIITFTLQNSKKIAILSQRGFALVYIGVYGAILY